MGQVVVMMTPEEILRGKDHARACQAFIQANGYRHAYGWQPDPKAELVGLALGFCAEIAVARVLNLPWDKQVGPQKRGDPDVGPLHVRATMLDHGSLLLHPGDPDLAPHVLVTGKPPTLTIRGWIAGQAGKQEWFWTEPQDGRPCYKIPQGSLLPLGDLEGTLELWRWALGFSPGDAEEAVQTAIARLPASALAAAPGKAAAGKLARLRS